MVAGAADARDAGRLPPDERFGAAVPPPPLHGQILRVAGALLAVLIGAAVAVAITASSGTVLGYTGGAVAAGALLIGGGTLAQAAMVRRRYIEALLRWAAAEPPPEQLGSIVLALTATGAHHEARTVLAVCELRSTPRTRSPTVPARRPAEPRSDPSVATSTREAASTWPERR
jgi:hypothetical protein